MTKKLLIICATHGNEEVGLEVVNKLTAKGLSGCFDTIVGNIKALEQNVRFVERDLNRSYPGNKDSEFYEERRAAEILSIVGGYEYVIDMHEASSGINDFVIIAKDRMCNDFPVELIDMDIVLLWPEPKGPLCEVVENSIELEFGMKDRNREEVVEKATSIVESFILKINSSQEEKSSLPKRVYRVYEELMTEDYDGPELKDFVEAEVGGEKFYPLLVGQYLDLGILCYKMKLMD